MSCDNVSMPYSHINQFIKRDQLFPAQLKLSTATLLNDVIDVRSSFYVSTVHLSQLWIILLTIFASQFKFYANSFWSDA